MDLKNPKWMYLKAAMFVGIGGLCFSLILLKPPTWQMVAYMLLMIWSFCRAYYFAFYVIEKYVDSEYRFAGLLDFLKYLLRKRGPK